MAHIETVQTGLRVITHVQGRVYRQDFRGKKIDHSLRARTAPAARKRRRICLLDASAAEGLLEFNISQPCFGPQCQHQHFTREQIQPLVKAGDLRWVGESMNVAAWLNPRHLVTRKSMGVSTVQLRPVGC